MSFRWVALGRKFYLILFEWTSSRQARTKDHSQRGKATIPEESNLLLSTKPSFVGHCSAGPRLLSLQPLGFR